MARPSQQPSSSSSQAIGPMPQPTEAVFVTRLAKFYQSGMRAVSPPRAAQVTAGSASRQCSRGRDKGQQKGGKHARPVSVPKEKLLTQEEWRQLERDSKAGHGNANQSPSGHGRQASTGRNVRRRDSLHTPADGGGPPAARVVLVHVAPQPDHEVINSVV